MNITAHNSLTQIPFVYSLLPESMPTAMSWDLFLKKVPDTCACHLGCATLLTSLCEVQNTDRGYMY